MKKTPEQLDRGDTVLLNGMKWAVNRVTIEGSKESQPGYQFAVYLIPKGNSVFGAKFLAASSYEFQVEKAL